MAYTVNTFDAFLYYVHKHMEWVKEETVSDCKEVIVRKPGKKLYYIMVLKKNM